MHGLRRYSYIRNTVSLVGATLILSGCFMQEDVEDPIAGLETDNEISGSVGDGPVVGATMRVLRNDGELLTELQSDFAASYNVSIKTKGKYYPLTIDSQDGTDIVTFLAPDFRMSTAVLMPGKKTVANVNPFTTVAMELASEMSGGRSTDNIEDALNIVVTQLNSGLDTLASTNPMSKKIDASNVAEIVRASETLGETIRRTRDAILAVGRTATGDAIVQSLGSDLTDFVVDGIGGSRTDARIAAVSTIAAAQTTLEAMHNRLQVNGSDATTVMAVAIGQVIAGQPQIALADLATTGDMIRQARIGVIAAERIFQTSELTELRQAILNLQPGMSPSVVDSILPDDASQLLDTVLLTVAAGDESLLDTVNDTARDGGALPTANRAPTIQGSPATSVAVGANYEFLPAADDPDGDALAFTISGRPLWAYFDASTGALTGKPGAGDVGLSTNIVIGVSDGELNASLPSFSILVEEVATNSPPSISGSPEAVITVGNYYDFTATASDPDGDSLLFSISNKPAWARFSTSRGNISGTPGNGDEGVYGNILISVTDGKDNASLAPFSITVNAAPVNQPPSISGTPASTAVVDSAYAFAPTASDPEGSVMTFSIAGKPPWTSFDSSSGRLAGTPGTGDVGIHGGIVITVSDGEDSASLGPFDISVESVALGSATLSWMPPTENDDGSPLTDLAGYKISWSTSSGSVSNSVTLNNPGLTTYVIDNLTPGTYEFVSKAFNAAGIESNPSNVATEVIP